MRTYTLAALLAVALPLGASTNARATASSHASPSAIVFAGPPLPKPVILRGGTLTGALLGQLSHGRLVPGDTLHRRHLEVGMFYARSMAWAARRDSIGWDHADLRGRYYPRQARRPALLLFPVGGNLLNGYSPWMGGSVLNDSAIAILDAHGIPTR